MAEKSRALELAEKNYVKVWWTPGATKEQIDKARARYNEELAAQKEMDARS